MQHRSTYTIKQVKNQVDHVKKGAQFVKKLFYFPPIFNDNIISEKKFNALWIVLCERTFILRLKLGFTFRI